MPLISVEEMVKPDFKNMALRHANRNRPRRRPRECGVSLLTELHPRPRDGATIRALSLQRIDTTPKTTRGRGRRRLRTRSALLHETGSYVDRQRQYDGVE